MKRKYSLDTFAVRNSPDCKRLVQAPAFSADHDASKYLDSLLIAFHNASVHPYAVADRERLRLSFFLLLLNSVDHAVHKRPFEAEYDCCDRAGILSALAQK